MAPPWFAPVQQQLNAIQQQLTRLDSNVAKVRWPSSQQMPKLHLFFKMMNAANGDGSIEPFVIVPFVDGSDPTTAPVRILSILCAWPLTNAINSIIYPSWQHVPSSTHFQQPLQAAI